MRMASDISLKNVGRGNSKERQFSSPKASSPGSQISLKACDKTGSKAGLSRALLRRLIRGSTFPFKNSSRAIDVRCSVYSLTGIKGKVTSGTRWPLPGSLITGMVTIPSPSSFLCKKYSTITYFC